MDPRVRGNADGTLYLADLPQCSVAQQKSHGLLYYMLVFALVVFLLGSLAVTAFFVLFLVFLFL